MPDAPIRISIGVLWRWAVAKGGDQDRGRVMRLQHVGEGGSSAGGCSGKMLQQELALFPQDGIAAELRAAASAEPGFRAKGKDLISVLSLHLRG